MGDAVDRLRLKLEHPSRTAPIKLATVTVERPVVGYPRIEDGQLQWVDSHLRHMKVNVGTALPHLAGGQYFRDLSPATQEFLETELANRNITLDSLIDEFRTRIGGPHDPIIEEAAAWYPLANRLAFQMSQRSQGRVSHEQAAGVIAVISPNTNWEMNSETAGRIVQFFSAGEVDGITDLKLATSNFKQAWQERGWGGVGVSGENRKNTVLAANIEKAFDILMDPDSLDDNLTSNKVHAFFNNIIAPGRTADVTVDIHMTKTLGFVAGLSQKEAEAFVRWSRHSQDKTTKAGKFTPGIHVGGVGFSVLASAMRILAADWGIPPDVLQAAYWLKVRELQPPGWNPPRAAWRIDTPLVTELLGDR